MRVLTTLVVLCLSSHVFANMEGAFLDPEYTDLVPPINDELIYKGFQKNKVFKSDTLAVIKNSTPVKSQGSRGTCSIFSATALLETLLISKKNFSKTLDLSEEYLEYLIVRKKTSDGSNSSKNFEAIRKYGVPYEKTYPYIPDNWFSNSWASEAEAKCGHLSDDTKTSCLLGHRDPGLLNATKDELTNELFNTYDPEFLVARTEAETMRDKHIQVDSIGWYGVYGVSEIKRKLDAGIPLTIGITVYYGAWNHSLANSYGIGRDSHNWNQGIVGYPEPGSKDRKISREHRAGHSVLIVGYDDEKEVTTTVEMEDGTTKSFTYKGVYYMKNSWGTNGFGSDFILEDTSLPGYGMITQKYANEMGGFFELPLK